MKLLQIVLLALPMTAWAQTPPPEVDQALRARVNEFFQYHVDGNFIKAFNLVAEDTRDYYFNSSKNKLETYKIESIEYSDNFTKAVVMAMSDRIARPSAQFPEVKITVPMKTDWKIENDKWYYTHDPTKDPILPMIPGIPVQQPTAGAGHDAGAGAVKPPANLSDKALAEQARMIMNQGRIDKTDVTLATDKASSDKVIFHNGYPGGVQLALNQLVKVPGFTAQLEKSSVNANEDAALKLRYEPADGAPAPPSVVSLELRVLPFNQTFSVIVKFAKP